MMHLRELDEVADFRLTPKQNARVDGLLAESDSLRCFASERIYKMPELRPSSDRRDRKRLLGLLPGKGLDAAPRQID